MFGALNEPTDMIVGGFGCETANVEEYCLGRAGDVVADLKGQGWKQQLERHPRMSGIQFKFVFVVIVVLILERLSGVLPRNSSKVQLSMIFHFSSTRAGLSGMSMARVKPHCI